MAAAPARSTAAVGWRSVGCVCERAPRHATHHEHDHEVGADGGRGDAPEEHVERPIAVSGGLFLFVSQLAGTKSLAALSATAGTAAPAPAAAPRIQSGGTEEDRGESKDQDQPGKDEAQPTRDGTGDPRSRHAQKMASWVDAGPGRRFGGDAVLELVGRSTGAVDTQPTQQRDVGRRSPEPDATHRSHSLLIARAHTLPPVLLGFLPRRSQDLVAEHLTGHLSGCRLVDSKTLSPLAVAT